MGTFLTGILGPGLWTNGPATTALIIGTAVALSSSVTGVFLVLRRQSFLGHALGAVSSTGASGSYVVSMPSLWGFFVGALAGSLLAGRRDTVRGHDVATGILLAFALGVSALFLQFTTQMSAAANAPSAVLFGSIFTVSPHLIPEVLAGTVACLLLLAIFGRPLLFLTLAPETAQVRRVPRAWVGGAFSLTLALAVAQAALVVGSLISTALLIGPAAVAVSTARRPATAIAIAGAVSLGVTWLSILLSYDSYLWPPLHRGWPVSFFVAALMLLLYVAARLLGGRTPAREVP